MRIRPETPADHAAVYDINVQAFPSRAEAELVDQLRAQASPLISLVAEEGETLLGHILFSPVTLPPATDSAAAGRSFMGLAPMAVKPARQGSGIGSALVQEGLAACRELGVDAVVVLGHPGYYPRFGFRPSLEFGIDSVYEVPAEVFMARELTPGALEGIAGTVRYHPAFDAL